MLKLPLSEVENQEESIQEGIKELFLKLGCMTTPMRIPNKDGYHTLYGRVNGKSCRQLAHRLMYEAFWKKSIDGKVVRHICDNPWCINPFHLKIGTHSDNVNDRVARGRSAIGDKNGRSKLTPAQAWQIKVDDKTPIKRLARQYGVTRRAVRLIQKGENWKYLNENPGGDGSPPYKHIFPKRQIADICNEDYRIDWMAKKYNITPEDVMAIRAGREGATP